MSDDKRQQVIALGRLGWSLRGIEQATGVRRETASAYIKAAGLSVRQPGWKRAAKPAIEVTTDSGLTSRPTKKHSPSRTLSSCEPYREFIQESLQRGRNATAIWQDLVTEQGFTHSYQSVKRFVNKLYPPELQQQARAVIVTEPGEEAQVDYGTGPLVRDPQTGKYRRTRLFVLTLGYSRKCVRLLTFRSSSRIWAELHEAAFRRLGGSVRVVVLDNLKEGVLKPDVYDPALNPLYRDVLAHYGAVALPCRIKDPDRKAYVSYCTLCRFCNDESWLLGFSTSDTFDERLVLQRFVKTTSVIVVALLLQQSLSSPGSDGRSSDTELCAHFSGREQSFCPQPFVTTV